MTTAAAGDGIDLLAQEIELVPLEQLIPHPQNPNIGDPEEIVASASKVGFYQVVFAQRSSRRILAGEHRWKALRLAGSAVAPVVWLDVDDDDALTILLGDNEIPRNHSRADARALAAALGKLGDSDDALVGTGHDAESFRKLMAGLADPTPPPEFPDAEAMAGHTQHKCPSCGYEWSGSPTPAK